MTGLTTTLELTLSPKALEYMRAADDPFDWICRAAEQYAKGQERRANSARTETRTYADRKLDLQVSEKKKLLKRAIEDGSPLWIAERQVAVFEAEVTRAAEKLAAAKAADRTTFIERYSKALRQHKFNLTKARATVERLKPNDGDA